MSWKVENDKVSFEVMKNHKFYIKRIENGFEFKVFDERGKPVILYCNKLMDNQLGLTDIDND